MRKYWYGFIAGLVGMGLALAFAGAKLMPDVGVQTITMVEHEDKVTALIEDGICWGNDGLIHPTPSHVVYDGELRGSRLTHLVLDQMFGGVDHGLDLTKVEVFCL